MNRTYNVPREPASYLGHRLEISQATVRVFSPTGDLVGRVASIGSARRLVRSVRRSNRNGGS